MKNYNTRLRLQVLNAVAAHLNACGFSVEVHVDMTETLVIRGALSGGVYVAGTNLSTWAADYYANEDAYQNGRPGVLNGGFSTSLMSDLNDADAIFVTLCDALEQLGERRMVISKKEGR